MRSSPAFAPFAPDKRPLESREQLHGEKLCMGLYSGAWSSAIPIVCTFKIEIASKRLRLICTCRLRIIKTQGVGSIHKGA